MAPATLPRGIDHLPSGAYRVRRTFKGRSYTNTYPDLGQATLALRDLDQLISDAKLRRITRLEFLPWHAKDLVDQLDARAKEVTRREEAIRAPEAPWITELANAYLTLVEREKSRNTYMQYRVAIRGFLDFVGRDKQADVALTALQLRNYRASLVEAGKSATTASLRVTVISGWWRWCYANDDTFPNVPRFRPVDLQRKTAAPRPSPTLAELDAILTHFGKESWIGVSLAIARFTGLRYNSQILTLTRENIDLERRELHVRGGKGVQEERTLPLHENLVPLIETWLDAHPGGALFPVGGRTWVSTQLLDALKLLTKQNEIRRQVWDGPPRSRRTTHLFRSGFQAALRARGVPADTVRALVGHSRGLQGVYVSPDSLPLREAVAALPAISWTILGPGTPH